MCQEWELHSKLGIGTVIVGGMNVHHKEWLHFSRSTTPEGRALYTACLRCGFQEKVGKPTRHSYLLDLVLSDMDWVNCMYRFSIKWFNKAFLSAVRAAKRAREVVDRVRFINREVNSYIFRRVSPAFASYAF